MAYIVVATRNQHKVDEYRALINDDSVELTSLLDYPDCPEVEENGKTFAENAALKAVAASKFCDSAAFADDSGLEVVALGGAPGIYSARYAETPEARIAKLLKAMENQTDRRARFVCNIAIAFNGEVIADFEGEVKGKIAMTPRGEGGFGYDEQVRLRDECLKLKERGIAFRQSNSDCPAIRELYEGFTIRTVQAKRAINSKGDRRGAVNEVLISG